MCPRPRPPRTARLPRPERLRACRRARRGSRGSRRRAGPRPGRPRGRSESAIRGLEGRSPDRTLSQSRSSSRHRHRDHRSVDTTPGRSSRRGRRRARSGRSRRGGCAGVARISSAVEQAEDARGPVAAPREKDRATSERRRSPRYPSARSESEPARNPCRAEAFVARTTRYPRRSRLATPRSSRTGSTGPEIAATPIVSPGCRAGGQMKRLHPSPSEELRAGR